MLERLYPHSQSEERSFVWRILTEAVPSNIGKAVRQGRLAPFFQAIASVVFIIAAGLGYFHAMLCWSPVIVATKSKQD